MRDARPSLRNSFFSWLIPAQSGSSIEFRMTEIRSAMLQALATHGQQNGKPAFAHLERRLRYVNDIQGLWYARSDLMQAIAACQGEARARQQIQGITALFDGLQPGGGASRPSPLSTH